MPASLRLLNLVRNLFRRDLIERDLDAEIRSYAEMLAAEKISRGAEPEAARREAMIELGGIEQVKEDVREHRAGACLEGILGDVRQGVRSLAAIPGFSAVALLSLALGVGSSAALFSVAECALLRPLPYSDSGRLVRVTDFYPKAAVREMQRASRTMDLAAFSTDTEFNLRGCGEPVHVSGSVVSPGLFSLLGVGARIGRVFDPADGRFTVNGPVIICDALWRRKFGSDPAILGRAIDVEGRKRRVVGVMPADFAFPSGAAQLWLPLTVDPANWVDSWAAGFMPMIGKLRAGVTVGEAREELRRLIAQTIPMFPYSMAKTWNADTDVMPLREAMVGDFRLELAVLAAAVGIFLLIACVNLAGLLLSRAAKRHRELAVRQALGASTRRIVRQLITESLVLAAAGGGLGLAFTLGILSSLRAVLPPDAARVIGSGLDWRALLFGILTVAAAGIGCGIASGMGLPKDLAGAVNAGGNRLTGAPAKGIRRWLIAVEVALTVMLVISAGLLIRSLRQLTQANPALRAEQILTTRVYREEGRSVDRVPVVAFYETLLRRVRTISGVSEVAAASSIPFGNEETVLPFEVEGHPLEPERELAPLVRTAAVTPGYFRILRIPLTAGRPFGLSDGPDAPGVVVVSEVMAHRFWPGQNPLGKHIRPVWDKAWRTVVGIARYRAASDLEEDEGAVFMPYPQSVDMSRRVPAAMTLVVRTTADASRAGREIQAVIRSLDPRVPVGPALTMQTMVSASVAQPRSMTRLFVAFAISALVLVAVGVYGLISYSIAQRRHEIAIRLALGASRSSIYSLVLERSMEHVLAGLAAGVAASLALTRLMTKFLYHVTYADPGTYLAVALIVVTVAAAAGYVPTRRAVRQDLTAALRVE